MLRFANISLGSGGLPSCARCAEPAAASPRPAADVVADSVAQIVAWDATTGGPGPNIALAGMDAFDHPNLPEVLLPLMDLPVERIRLTTSGAALAAHDNARGCLGAGARHIEIVVLGGRETHEELTGGPGAFDRAAAGVARFRSEAAAAHLDVAVSGFVPVCRHNLESTAEAVLELARMGATVVTLDLSEAAAKSVAAPKAIAVAVETGVVHGTWVTVVGLESGASFSRLHAIAPAATEPATLAAPAAPADPGEPS